MNLQLFQMTTLRDMHHKRRILSATLSALTLAAACDAGAVRVNADGHGQALIYPYYTARSTPSGNAFVTALSVSNTSSSPKVVKVRFMESRTGASVFDLNLFLSGYDVWTAGIVPDGDGAGLFTDDRSCTSPPISRSGVTPTPFTNASYAGDTLGDDRRRTYEGYFEVLEMATIDPGSNLSRSITHALDASGVNLSKPTCLNLPTTPTAPAGLTAPSGGLMGNASLINVNEGTDFSIDAVALSQWSNRVQWSTVGSGFPNLSDTSPPSSMVVQTRAEGDRVIVTRWTQGRDAVSALFMVDHVINDYSVEPFIKAATDWVITMPTKRFYVTPGAAEAPFRRRPSAESIHYSFDCESRGISGGSGPLLPLYWDREELSPGYPIDFLGSTGAPLCGAVAVVAMTINSGMSTISKVLQSRSVNNIPLITIWWNGWLDLDMAEYTQRFGESSVLAAPAGSTSVMDAVTGAITSGMTATYFGLPVVGFAAQSYSTTGLPGVSATVLSNYGGSFMHRYRRRIEIGQ